MTADEPRGYCGKYCRLNLRAPGPHEAYCITFWGFISALVFCASSIAVALFTGSPAEFAFAFETGVDAIATSIVLWRFSDAEADAAAAERTERIASLCVSYAIVFLGVSSIAFAMLAAGDADARHSYKSISHQAHEQEWREQEEEMGVQILLSVPSAMVGACLGALQLFLGGALGSPSLEKDAIITLFGSATCLVARGRRHRRRAHGRRAVVARRGGHDRARPHPHRVRRPERRRRALRLRVRAGLRGAPLHARRRLSPPLLLPAAARRRQQGDGAAQAAVRVACTERVDPYRRVAPS